MDRRQKIYLLLLSLGCESFQRYAALRHAQLLRRWWQYDRLSADVNDYDARDLARLGAELNIRRRSTFLQSDLVHGK